MKSFISDFSFRATSIQLCKVIVIQTLAKGKLFSHLPGSKLGIYILDLVYYSEERRFFKIIKREL